MSENILMHHTKNKSDLGVLKIACDLIQRNHIILFPATEHACFDIVSYKDDLFYRIQCKYLSINKNGCITLKLSTSWADKNGNHHKLYDLSKIDIFAVYVPEIDKVLYIKSYELLNKKNSKY